MILTADNIRTTLELNRGLSVAQTAALLNERIASRIAFLADEDDKELIRAKRRSTGTILTR